MIMTRHKPRAALGALSLTAAFVAMAGASHAQTVGTAYTVPPSLEYQPLYRDVELAGIFPDSKTFPDLLPNETPAAILREYAAQKATPGFSLAAFVAAHFSATPVPAGPTVATAAPGTNLLDYIRSLWPVLAQTNRTVPPYSTLQPLPYRYVVPGGRFREVYYWDSYFTSLGLERQGQHSLVVSLLRDFAYEIDRYGHVPNGSRSYYISRSQPPFFSYLVELVAKRDGAGTVVTYLPELQKEYDYWMQGADQLQPGNAYHSAVRLKDGTLLNRNWDERAAPRDESYKEDVATAAAAPARLPGDVWRNLRATAASGWDFSSRWLEDGTSLSTVRTLQILPVDLNSLLTHLELTLAEGYVLKGDYGQALTYATRGVLRGAAIQRLMWDPAKGAFTDYLWEKGRRTGQVTAATLYPLYAHVATIDQANTVAATVRSTLLLPGGIVTSTVTSGQQWDAPNGWAPLQWIAVNGLRDYGQGQLAEDIATRWVRKTIAGFKQQSKLVEKYNVTTTSGDAGGGGEYATQIGFGWTNGVLVGLAGLYPALEREAAAAVAPGAVQH